MKGRESNVVLIIIISVIILDARLNFRTDLQIFRVILPYVGILYMQFSVA